MLYIDATQLRMFTDCRESYRLAYIENKTSAKPAIHRQFGIELHKAVEMFWRGASFEDALHTIMENLNNVSTYGCTPEEIKKWGEMVGYAPDMLACYWDGVEYDESRILYDHVGDPNLEFEWSFDYEGVSLCGRIDRCEVGPKLVDLKTASEVGKNWKHIYRETMLRDIGLALYDWYLCQIGHPPVAVELEVLIKPYRDRKARLERLAMHEIVTPAYRKRFESQLKWLLKELQHYHEAYASAKPWPQNTNSACHGKFGQCQYLPLCLYGENARTGKLYTLRQEHLDIRKEATA